MSCSRLGERCSAEYALGRSACAVNNADERSSGLRRKEKNLAREAGAYKTAVSKPVEQIRPGGGISQKRHRSARTEAVGDSGSGELDGGGRSVR